MALMVWPPEESFVVSSVKVALPLESVAVLVPVSAALSTRIWTVPVGAARLFPLAFATVIVRARLPEELLHRAPVVVTVVLEIAVPVVPPVPVGVTRLHL